MQLRTSSLRILWPEGPNVVLYLADAFHVDGLTREWPSADRSIAASGMQGHHDDIAAQTLVELWRIAWGEVERDAPNFQPARIAPIDILDGYRRSHIELGVYEPGNERAIAPIFIFPGNETWAAASDMVRHLRQQLLPLWLQQQLMEFDQALDPDAFELLNHGFETIVNERKRSLNAVIAWLSCDQLRVERAGSVFFASSRFLEDPESLIRHVREMTP